MEHCFSSPKILKNRIVPKSRAAGIRRMELRTAGQPRAPSCAHREPMRGAMKVLAACAALVSVAQPAQAGPCDIYAKAGTPCAAAHSLVRSLFSAYTGALYQLQRAGDNTTLDIHALKLGGVADAAAHDKFCAEKHPPPPPPIPYPPGWKPFGPGYPARADCVVNKIYDQTGNLNHLLISTPAINNPAYNNPVNATKHPILIGGHRAYGAYFETGARACAHAILEPCAGASMHHAQPDALPRLPVPSQVWATALRTQQRCRVITSPRRSTW